MLAATGVAGGQSLACQTQYPPSSACRPHAITVDTPATMCAFASGGRSFATQTLHASGHSKEWPVACGATPRRQRFGHSCHRGSLRIDRTVGNTAGTERFHNDWWLHATNQQEPDTSTTSQPMFVEEYEETDTPGIPVLTPRAPGRRALQRPPHRPSPPLPDTRASPVPDHETQQQEVSSSNYQRPLFDSSRAETGSPQAYEYQDAADYSDDNQADYSDDYQEGFSYQQQLRIAYAQPLQLVPINARSMLLDPDNPQQPLATTAPTSKHTSSTMSGSHAGEGCAIPLQGPWILTNHKSAFRGCDAIVSYTGGSTDVPDRLAIRLEYVAQRNQEDQELAAAWQREREEEERRRHEQHHEQHPESNVESQSAIQHDDETEMPLSSQSYGSSQTQITAVLRLFNISRTRRGRAGSATMVVSRAAQMGQLPRKIRVKPGSKAVTLQAGDVIHFGNPPHAPSFKVVPCQAPHTVDAVLALAAQENSHWHQKAQQQQQQRQQHLATTRNRPREGSVEADAMAARAGEVLNLLQLRQVARRDPEAAIMGYATLLSGPERHNAFVWIACAQLYAQQGMLTRARRLFRAAVAAALPGSPEEAAGQLYASQLWQSSVTRPGFTPSYNSSQHQDINSDNPTVSNQNHTSTYGAETSHGHLQAGNLQQNNASPDMLDVTAPVLPISSETLEVLRAQGLSATCSVALVQALFSWARFEWTACKLKGSARHLWRMAADIAMLHPEGPKAGGLNHIMHAWATSELEQGNILNARVVVAEALNKCPKDQPLYVAAANIELKANNLEDAYTLCQNAYELNRTDKHLYLVWPMVCVKQKEFDKARALFERGLDYHPYNVKIMNMYSDFEAKAGDIEKAIDLQERALEVDPLSWTSMFNRVALAKLYTTQRRLKLAKRLLDEGLRAHPNHWQSLLALSRVYRRAGNLEQAQLILRQASKMTHQFNEELLKERLQLFRSLGQHAIADNIRKQLDLQKQVQQALADGQKTGDVWTLYTELSSSQDRKLISREAFEAKKALGWLSEPGKPGPKAARRTPEGEVPFVPLPNPHQASFLAMWEQAEAQQQQEQEGNEYDDDGDDDDDVDNSNPVLADRRELPESGEHLNGHSQAWQQPQDVSPVQVQDPNQGYMQQPVQGRDVDTVQQRPAANGWLKSWQDDTLDSMKMNGKSFAQIRSNSNELSDTADVDNDESDSEEDVRAPQLAGSRLDRSSSSNRNSSRSRS